MQNKRPRPQAIDNFIPSGRSLHSPPNRHRSQRFPDVGATISPYRRSGALGPVTAERRAVSAATRRRKPGKKQRRWHWTRKRIIFALLLPFLLVGLWLGIKFGFNVARIFDGNIFSIFSTTKLKGEDEGRVNILLAGNSADDPGHNGGDLTDSIMILSLDTRNNRAFMLSIPRDLYVPIPGTTDHSKINAAYVFGKQSGFKEAGYPNGGMGLLEKTIAMNLDIKPHYYALINYSALRDAVNAVGGVDITIDSGSSCGLYDPSINYYTNGPLVDLDNGRHTLNGQEALGLARARGDHPRSCGYARSDFVRSENQRKLLLAIKDKVFSTGVLANPLTLSKLFDSLGKNVKTDMQLSEVRRLNDLMKKVDNGNIKSYSLDNLNDKNYLSNYRTTSGQSALIPSAGLDNFSEIKQAIRRLMSTNKLTLEDASVVLLNATDTSGLASKNETELTDRNIAVSAIADAKAPSRDTYIIARSETAKPATLAALKAIYGDQVTSQNPYKQKYAEADFIIILGDDRVASNQ